MTALRWLRFAVVAIAFVALMTLAVFGIVAWITDLDDGPGEHYPANRER